MNLQEQLPVLRKIRATLRSEDVAARVVVMESKGLLVRPVAQHVQSQTQVAESVNPVDTLFNTIIERGKKSGLQQEAAYNAAVTAFSAAGMKPFQGQTLDEAKAWASRALDMGVISQHDKAVKQLVG